MASFEGDNQVVFYYFSTSEIWPVTVRWPDNRDGLIIEMAFGGRGLIRSGLLYMTMAIPMILKEPSFMAVIVW